MREQIEVEKNNISIFTQKKRKITLVEVIKNDLSIKEVIENMNSNRTK